jgi:uncharacterized protein YggE
MQMKLLVLAAVLVTITGAAPAEERPPAKVVRVFGTSDVKVVPDRAVIELGVEKQSTSARLAKQAEDAAARRLLATLRSNGIEDKDVQTTYLSLRPQFDYRKGMRISYFAAEQTMTVTVRDIAKLDVLVEALMGAGGNRIDSIQYETSDLRKYRDQARDLAVKAAREKAQALAAALGQGIGKAQSIEEVPGSTDIVSAGLANTSFELGRDRRKQLGPSTAAGQNTISASVIVSFELN